jgi:hypothetical protein
VIGSRVAPEVWVTDSACILCQKARCGRAFWRMVVKVKRWEGVYTFGVYDCVCSEAATMRHLMPWRTERGRYFHAHPQQAMFSLIASMLLAGLVVLALALSAR